MPSQPNNRPTSNDIHELVSGVKASLEPVKTLVDPLKEATLRQQMTELALAQQRLLSEKMLFWLRALMAILVLLTGVYVASTYIIYQSVQLQRLQYQESLEQTQSVSNLSSRLEKLSKDVQETSRTAKKAELEALRKGKVDLVVDPDQKPSYGSSGLKLRVEKKDGSSSRIVEVPLPRSAIQKSKIH